MRCPLMLGMTRAINVQHFPEYHAKSGESGLERVTCDTCHQGAAEPRTAPPHPGSP